MKKLRLLIALLLALLMVLGSMPFAFAVECPGSPSGSHNWYTYWSGSWTGPCTWEGWVWEECTYCLEARNWRYVTDYYHNWTDWFTYEKAGGCNDPGTLLRYCTVCGQTESQPLYEPHSYGPWTVLEEPTDHSAGVREHTCSACGLVDQQPFDPEGTLRIGDKGDAVQQLQQWLIEKGFLSAGGADGDFGQGTEKAVKAFQSSAGLTADGVAWPQTILLLNPDAVLSEPDPEPEAEPDPEATDAAAVDSCGFYPSWTETGELVRAIGLCQTHGAINIASASLPTQSKNLLWSSALEMEYQTLLSKASSEDDKAVIQQEREAFEAWLEAYSSYLQAAYPDWGTTFVQEELVSQRMRQCARLCCLNHENAPLPAPPAFTGTASALAPEHCGPGETGTQLCETHRTMSIAAAAVGGEQGQMLWRMAEQTQRDSLLAETESGPRGAVYRGLITSEGEAFALWLESFGRLIALQRPEEPEAAAAFTTEQLMEYVIDRCYKLGR